MALRESPVRRTPRARPTWLVALLIAVAVLVVLGIGYGIVSLVRGSSGPEEGEAAAATPAPCQTELVPAVDVLPAPKSITVNVYNATGTSGLASKTATALEDRDFAVGKVANDPTDKAIAGVAEIRFGAKAADKAQVLLAYVPGATLVELQRKGTKVDLAMGDGFTGLAPQPEVDAALAMPTPVATGPGCPSGAGAGAGADAADTPPAP